MGHLGEIQLSFPFPSLPSDYFDVQDLRILLSFEIIVAKVRFKICGLNFEIVAIT